MNKISNYIKEAIQYFDLILVSMLSALWLLINHKRIKGLLDFNISICFLLGSLITLASHVSVHDVLATLAPQSLL